MAEGNEYQHIALYGDCRGLILDDYTYYAQSTYDIRDLIYTDTVSNLEQMTILQEPFTRWFKPIGGLPYFSDGSFEKRLATQEDLDAYFDTDVVKGFTDVLSGAIDTDGTIYNGIGYKAGRRMETNGTELDSPYYVLTGFIPCTKGDTIYAHDLSFAEGDENCRVQFFDADFNTVKYGTNNASTALINRNNLLSNGNTYVASYAATDDGFSLTLSGNVVHNTTAYARFVIYKSQWGTNPMIAIDEEIKYTVEGFLTDGVRVKGDSVILTSPGGKTFKLMASDDGTIAAKAIE